MNVFKIRIFPVTQGKIFSYKKYKKRKLAGQVRQSTRRAIQSEKITIRQPLIDVKDYIDQAILEGDRLKLQAEQYLA
ncbi:hypothetical protein [Rivularia sp. UHCC 0363]|uniref:hypothetical protein n=1 Tax=Rivularia sp. UHCC 0363 TaxID=3110244 RepID=UPI002B1F790C|nr:hypothetical protein [Rivularia sp. UHCC 0363]MEA5596587.1 hypothetical protein [Rivularia sp. UHCC 0363]